jgi:hypothetical protein
MRMMLPSRLGRPLSLQIECPLGVVLLLLTAIGFAAPAAAQQYREDKPDETARRNQGIALACVRDANRYATDKEKFEEFFANYFFKDMTRSGADDLARVGARRFELFKNYLWATTNEALQRDLTELALTSMRPIVVANNPPYHPAVRYNAVLTLGMLDEQYAIDAGTNRRPPRPHPAARALLIQIVSAGAEDKPVPPVLVLGALIGLERHAQYQESFEAGAADAMTKALLKLVDRENPIQDMDREAYTWLRLRAAGVLAQLGSVGPSNEVHDALLKLVGDFRSLDDRTAAAALLAKMKYDEAKVDGAPAVEQMFKLARDVGAAEAKRAEDFQNTHPAVGGSFGPGRERSIGFGMAGEQEAFPRRHVLARLVDLRTGLQAVKKLVAEDAQANIDAVIKAIDPVIAAAANQDVVELKLAAAIHTMAAAIDRAAAPAEKPADEKDAEDAFETAASG